MDSDKCSAVCLALVLPKRPTKDVFVHIERAIQSRQTIPGAISASVTENYVVWLLHTSSTIKRWYKKRMLCAYYSRCLGFSSFLFHCSGGVFFWIFIRILDYKCGLKFAYVNNYNTDQLLHKQYNVFYLCSLSQKFKNSLILWNITISSCSSAFINKEYLQIVIVCCDFTSCMLLVARLCFPSNICNCSACNTIWGVHAKIHSMLTKSVTVWKSN